MWKRKNHLYFATSEKKQVWQELQKNPNVEILASEGNISVRCSGMVCFLVDDETRRWIFDHSPINKRI